MVIDLQTHTGAHGLSADAIVRKAVALEMDGVALLGDDQIPKVAEGLYAESVRIFLGAEVATDRGHYIVFLPEPRKLPPLMEILGQQPDGRWPVRDVLARVNALGGAAVAACPYDMTVDHPGGDILYTLAGVSAVQVVAPLHPRDISFPAIEAAECLGLPTVGGSGARGSVEDVGRAGTIFGEPIHNEEELISALRGGSCWPVEFGEVPQHLARQRHSELRQHHRR